MNVISPMWRNKLKCCCYDTLCVPELSSVSPAFRPVRKSLQLDFHILCGHFVVIQSEHPGSPSEIKSYNHVFIFPVMSHIVILGIPLSPSLSVWKYLWVGFSLCIQCSLDSISHSGHCLSQGSGMCSNMCMTSWKWTQWGLSCMQSYSISKYVFVDLIPLFCIHL